MKLFAGLLLLAVFLLISDQSQALCASLAKVNLYKGPGPKFPRTWTVGKYMPLFELERQNRWIKVKDLDGEEHWVDATQVTNKYRCVVVKSSVAQLRLGAGQQFPPPALMITADRYTPFKRIESEGPWVQVENDFGIKAWIHEKNLWKPTSVVKMTY